MKALAMFPDQRWSNAGEMERMIMNLPPLPVSPIGSIAAPVRTELAPLANPNTPNNVRPSGPNNGPVSPPAQLGINGPAGQQIIGATNAVLAGRVDEAYALVQRAYGLEPNNALVHKLFGQVFARRQQVDPAVQAYIRSLQLNVEDAETHKLLGDVWLFLRQQPLQATTEYIQAVRYNPRDYETHQRLAQSYERTQQFDLALRAYQEAVRLAPKQPSIIGPIQFALGQLAMRLNQFQIAEQAFVQVLMINAADYQARFLLSQAYEKQNKLEDAFRECSYVVGPLGQSNPAVPQLYQRLRTQLGR
jgi:tetratricopeptide (TPR) repeat protein